MIVMSWAETAYKVMKSTRLAKAGGFSFVGHLNINLHEDAVVLVRWLGLVAVVSGLSGCNHMAWKQYTGPAENLSQIDLVNEAPTWLWPNTFVDGDACQLPGFGDLVGGAPGRLATILANGHTARYNVEKNKLFTLYVLLSDGPTLGYGTHSVCEVVYSFVPTSDKYVIKARMSANKKACSAPVKSFDGKEPAIVRRIHIAGRWFNPPHCLPLLVEDKQKLGLPVP